MSLCFSLLQFPHFLSPKKPNFLSLKPTTFRPLSAIPNPADDDPPEAEEDTSHGFSKFQQINRQASRARKLEEEDFKKNQQTYLNALQNDATTLNNQKNQRTYINDDFFSEIDKAIALKRKEFVKQGLIKETEEVGVVKDLDDDVLEDDEVGDLDEITELNGKANLVVEDDDGFDFESFGMDDTVRMIEPGFKMTLAELLDESKLVPVSVYGDLEVEIRGIQHDSRLVSAGDLFVCCVGKENDGHLFLTEADKRGAVAVVASKEISIEETLGCKALVIVEDGRAILGKLGAAFYRWPSRELAVIGVTGTSGKTATSYLVRSMYEAMGMRTGMFSSVDCFVHGDSKLEVPDVTSLDSVMVQSMMAKMLHNGTEAVVMEASSDRLGSGRCDEVDFDIAVFTNLTQDRYGFKGSEVEYRENEAKLFSRMVDPERHRKIVNIDDPNASYFVSLGNPDVPVVTFAMENKTADVHPVRFELSLFETQVLVNTPLGILEISSGLLGRHNIYNILAAVAVGIAVGAPLEDIVRGIEEVDSVPGRCELIDEEQAFGVIVDYADTPDGLSRLLDSVRELGARRVITVIGCPGESERGKRPMMTKIATDKSDVTILTSDNPKNEDPLDILDDMLAGVGWTMQEYLKHGENDYYPPLPNGNRLFLHDIRRVAVRCAVAMGEEGDMVVVAGKGHVTNQIEGEKNEFFDDREECREALQYVDELHRAGIDTSEFPWRLPESH